MKNIFAMCFSYISIFQKNFWLDRKCRPCTFYIYDQPDYKFQYAYRIFPLFVTFMDKQTETEIYIRLYFHFNLPQIVFLIFLKVASTIFQYYKA